MVAFSGLDAISPGAALDELNKAQLRAVQRALAFLCYPSGVIDGLFGPKTRSSFAEFKDDIGEGNPNVVSQRAIDELNSRSSAIDAYLNVSVSNATQAKTAIDDLCKVMGLGMKEQRAYVLATTEWETAHTFQPVKEAFWLDESWRKNHLSYYPYYGRGYVQLTWKRNYQQYTDILDVDMVSEPNLAMVPSSALFILVHGFITGTFTTRKITEFINAGLVDYRSARKCINGTDKADEIKKLAEQYFLQI